ncbi:hypothetical protein ONS95_007967 [Cadophora gregata]|uniref:uncharacterized protein n=1 Tax=Cadophora gregata TaxID=51156 RepID=UPI0026DB5733|nr:uncharacterized protein ONS95_007967 [Cadophora gregata]KAK0126361.1 hypothetical protein ONS95_007967 [Cadophora gregata]
MDQLQDRADAQIWNAIESKSLKQALKLVDKRLAKKHTPYHEALKIYIRALSPQATEKAAVLVHLEELAEKKTVPSELVVAELYDDALNEVLPVPRENWARIVGELRWQCVKASPKNEDASLKCFQACLARNDLDHARQIANSLEKTFPQNHAYTFWNISTMYLYSMSPSCPEVQKKIWGGLALGQIGKLATATKQAADHKQLPARSIQSPQELLLLHRITKSYGKREASLDYLLDPLLGPESAVAKGEWELWRMKLELLQSVQDWKTVFETTGSLLKRARTTDTTSRYSEARLSDWIVWDAYIGSAKELNSTDLNSQVREELEAHLDPACKIDKSWKRNASLALIKFAFESPSPTISSGDINVSYRGSTISKYLQDYGSANTAYNDLRPFVGRLSQDERKQLRGALDRTAESRDLSTIRQITESINSDKLRYLLGSCLPELERIYSPERRSASGSFFCTSCSEACGISCKHCLTLTAEESIKSYRVAARDDKLVADLPSTDRHPADDFSILSAMCLIKLALAESGNSRVPINSSGASYLLQAAVLLEVASVPSRSNFQISLILVRLYCYLGCGSLAMRAFERLSLKQVQLDTLSYVILDRISTFHPHPFGQLPNGSDNTRTPLEQLQKQRRLYRSAQEHVIKNVWLSFKHSSYNSVFEISEVQDSLSRSLARVMYVVESSKVARLLEPKRSLAEIIQEYDIVAPNAELSETTFADTNDYETFPNYESFSGPRFEELSRFFPRPTEYRYRQNLVTQKLLILIDPSTPTSGEGQILQQWLKQYIDFQKNCQIPKVGSEDLTGPEALAKSTYDAMAFIIYHACDRALCSESDIMDKLDSYNKDLAESLEKHLATIDKMEDLVPAFASTLHTLYTAHEVGTAVVNLCSYISRRGKDVSDKQAEANKTALDLAQRLLQATIGKSATVKSGLDEGGWIDKVLECVLPDATGGEQRVSPGLVEALREHLDEGFLEQWAGEVTESWRDSVAGLSLLKAPGKA